MKYKAKLFIGASLLVVLSLPFGVAIAHAEENTNTNTTPTSGEARETETTQKKDTPEALRQRLGQRKAEFKAKLQATEQTRLKGRCKAAQSVLNGVGQRLDNTAANHTKSYSRINTKLTELIPKLEARGLDVTALKAAQTTLATKITAYEADLKNYQQVVNDLKSMEDCTVDPTAFKASLEVARTLRQKLHDSAVDIRTHITQTIKPALAQLRTQLAQKETSTTGESN